MTNSTTTVQYANIYREKEGGISFGFLTESPENAATYVCLVDGIPISLLKLEYDTSKPFGERITATEIRQ